jgi:hypothetical protein
MAIALGSRPDESAKMVWSRECMAYLPTSPPAGKTIHGGPSRADSYPAGWTRLLQLLRSDYAAKTNRVPSNPSAS